MRIVNKANIWKGRGLEARDKEALMVPIVLPGEPEELIEYEKVREMKSLFLSYISRFSSENIISSHFDVDTCCNLNWRLLVIYFKSKI